MFWFIYTVLIIGMVLHLFDLLPSPPDEELANTNLLTQNGAKPSERREANPQIEQLLARMKKVESRLDIERRIEVKDYF
jgi:uncharacterized protein YneF (UPF0154 family)